MTVVVGREANDPERRPVADVGTYRALDGSAGAPLALDIDGPHAVLVVGKRGSGKSYTLGVLAEELAGCRGLAPVVVDPMGAFRTLASDTRAGDAVPASVVEDPAVVPSTLDPRSWCSLVGLSPEGGAGALVWQAAAAAETLEGMAAHVGDADGPMADARAARNHIRLAASWGVFDPDGLTASDLATRGATVLDLSGTDAAPMNAVVRAVAEGLYRARIEGTIERLPWLLVDETHTFFDGVAAGALRKVLTRGRTPGVSLVLATQRPSSLPAVAISQSDTLVAHRLTSAADIDALREARPGQIDADLVERLPEAPGEAVVLDDATEAVHAASIRRRHTPHGGGNPSVSENYK